MAIQPSPHRAEKVLLAALFGFFVLLTLQVRRGQKTLLVDFALWVFSPLGSTYEAADRLTREGLQAYIWQRDAAVEAERLAYENRLLKGQIMAQGYIRDENARLRQLLEIPVPEGINPIGARALTQYGAPFNRYLMVSAENLLKTPQLTPVIVPEGVVGRVQSGGGGLLKCALITDPNSAVGVISQRVPVHGVAVGDGRNLLLRWVTNEADVKVGDAFITSGDDGVFPPSLPVGTVVSVADGPDYLKKVSLRPAANLGDLQWVLLLAPEQR